MAIQRITNEDLRQVGNLAETAREHGLLAEVVTFAIKRAKENPKWDVVKCMQTGFDEWVK